MFGSDIHKKEADWEQVKPDASTWRDFDVIDARG